MKKKIIWLATGGTVAGVGEPGKTTNYNSGQLDIEQLKQTLFLNYEDKQRFEENIELQGIQVCNVNSDDISCREWQQMASIINEKSESGEADGFIITHGTDTLEETAYYLSLATDTDKPVVITGSMRPSSALSPDGPANIYNAVCVAASEQSRGRGVSVTFSDSIFDARNVRKVSTFKVDSFDGSCGGSIGCVVDGEVYYNKNSAYVPDKPCDNFYRWLKRCILSGEITADSNMLTLKDLNNCLLPKVEIAYFCADADESVLDYFADMGAEGIVIAGAGAGCYSKRWNEKIKALSHKLVILRSSRIGNGLITEDDAYEGDIIRGNDLPPSKARILLRICIAIGLDRQSIRKVFKSW